MAVPPKLLVLALIGLTFLATGEPLGLEIEVDRSLEAGLRDDRERILQRDRSIGLRQKNLKFRDCGDFVPVVLGRLTFGSVEIAGDLRLVSFSWEALVV
jgi:hypothetical protein